MSDPIDDLLDRSAPALSDRGAGRDAALQQMMKDAGDTVRPPRTSRRRIAATSGVLALLLTGGAGVAVANSDWLWISEVDSHRSYSYVSPSWGQCELRFGSYAATNPLDQAGVDRVIDAVFADPDLEEKAAPLAARHLAEIESDQAADAEADEDPRTADLNAWVAHDQAVNDLVNDALGEHGYGTGEGDAVTGASGQVHCEGEEWGGEGGEQ